MNGRSTSLRDALILGLFTSKVKWTATLKASFRIAAWEPQADCQAACLFTAPLHPHDLFFLTFHYWFFLFCLSSNTNTKKFLVSQVALTTVWRALSLQPPQPVAARQEPLAQPSSSWEHQHSSSHGNCGDQAPAAREFQRNCRTLHSQILWRDHRWLS